MRVIVTGRSGSGKTTFKEIIKQIANTVTDTDLCNFISSYKEGDKVIVVDTPAILCWLRSGAILSTDDQKRDDAMISYVTELPNCTIIKNAGSLDEFRVKIKKLVKTL